MPAPSRTVRVSLTRTVDDSYDILIRPGLLAEIAADLLKRDGAARHNDRSNITYDPEEMKFLLENLCVGAGVRFQYFSRVVGAVKDGRRLRAVVVESPSGREAVAVAFGDRDGAVGAAVGGNDDLGPAGHQD